MKNLLIFLFAIIITSANAQTIEGDWKGALEVQGSKLSILFHITKDGDKWTSTMDSPDQGALGIPMDKTTVQNGKLTIAAPAMGMTYSATLNESDNAIEGTFNQGGMELPLNMSRVEATNEVVAKGDFNSPEILGDWNGVLDVQGTQLRVVFHLMNENGHLKGTMDSPDQGAKGIPMESTTYENGKLIIKASNMRMEYNAELSDDNSAIKGTFKQAGMEIPLELSKKKVEKKALVRPQEPKDFPYNQEEVKFVNTKGGHHLAGTLTTPSNGEFEKIAILITGSGPQNRDEELLGHKPFLVIADHLTRQGIAVLRYDDRGVGESEGSFNGATSRDFADDAAAAVAYLKNKKEYKGKAIGLVGHSEGGMIAPMVASENKDVDFIVLLAGPGIDIFELMIIQVSKINESEGATKEALARNEKDMRRVFDYMRKNPNADLKELEKGLDEIFEEVYSAMSDEDKAELDKETFFTQQKRMLLDKWFLYFINFNPADYLTQVKCPTLAVNGELDLQVTAKENLAGIKESLKKAKNKNATVKEFKGLNHLFQKTETGSTSEYGVLEETFNQEVLEYVSSWILKL